MNRDMYAVKKLHLDQTHRLVFVAVNDLLHHGRQVHEDCVGYLAGDDIRHLVQPAEQIEYFRDEDKAG